MSFRTFQTLDETWGGHIDMTSLDINHNCFHITRLLFTSPKSLILRKFCESQPTRKQNIVNFRNPSLMRTRQNFFHSYLERQPSLVNLCRKIPALLLYWLHQYGIRWHHLYIVDALSIRPFNGTNNGIKQFLIHTISQPTYRITGSLMSLNFCLCVWKRKKVTLMCVYFLKESSETSLPLAT